MIAVSTIFNKVIEMTTTTERELTEFELLTAKKVAAEARLAEVGNRVRAIDAAITRGTATPEQIAARAGLIAQATVYEREAGEALRAWKVSRKEGERETKAAHLEAAIRQYDAALPAFEETLKTLIGAATAYANTALPGSEIESRYGLSVRGLERIRDAIADPTGEVEAARARSAASFAGQQPHYMVPPLPTH
jgi:hypothetical protein